MSDTGVIHNNERLSQEQQLPKLAILNDRIAVGFAGSTDLAVRAIENAPRGGDASYGQVTDHFLSAHKQTNVDFIIGFGPPLSKLAAIKDDKIRQRGNIEWIGDKNGFEAYQRFRLERVKSSEAPYEPLLGTGSEPDLQTPLFNMLHAIRYAIQSKQAETVFGYAVALNNAEGAFAYRPYQVLFDPLGEQVTRARETSTGLLSQIAEAEAFAFSCFVGSAGDPTQAIAFHHLRGKLTHMYYGEAGTPLKHFRRYAGINIQEFTTATGKEFGIRWSADVLAVAGVPESYGLPRPLMKAYTGKVPVGRVEN